MNTKAKIIALAAALALISEGVIYPDTLKVTDVIEGGSEHNDIVTAETCTGISYQFYADDLQQGDTVSAILFNNFTQDVRDDAVISSKYSGFRLEE